jgi:hypothetical protein
MDGREKGVSALAIFNLEVKPIRRSQGGDARAAAAYRSGTRIGEYDYTRRRGVSDRALFLPPNAPAWDRAELWQEAEQAEKRKNSVTAREVLLALPHEMPPEGHRKAVEAFCGWLVSRTSAPPMRPYTRPGAATTRETSTPTS